MSDPAAQLKALKKTKDFFIGIDSDGCAFDSMEIKHKECFIPNTINSWDLQAVSRFARQAAEFVNLYSQWRGCNRFPALVMVFDLLADWPEAVERGYKPPQIESLRKWMKEETKLGNPTLTAKVNETHDPVLTKTLAWSKAVNKTIDDLVHGVPPFPHLRPCLEKFRQVADVVVVSATPGDALNREWAEHDIAKYVALICGQEMGSKDEHLKYGAGGGKYAPDHVLMIGDAPGDMKSGKKNNTLFYPINPGDEDASWKYLHDVALDKFLKGQYAGDFEKGLIDKFMTYLPSVPPWKKK